MTSSENNYKNRVIFFTGYPGSGKGTQAKKLAKALNLVHLSTGELFRKEAKTGSEIGLKMASFMEKGLIIPQDLTFEYLRRELSKPFYRNGIILDGYPKDIECCQFILKLFNELQFMPWLACHFSLPRQEVEERLMGRLHCKTCELDFHQEKLPPKIVNTCDNCQGTLECRLDDTIAGVRKRLDVFEQHTQPVLDKFQKLGLYKMLDANQTPDKVYSDLTQMIKLKVEAEHSSPYFLRLPKIHDVNQKFHNHIDAESEEVLLEIVDKVENDSPNFWNKIYPIRMLQLGPQVSDPEFAHLYSRLPNFHEIGSNVKREVESELKEEQVEAFATGKMGLHGFDYDQIRKTLEVCSTYIGRGVMTELEVEIFSSDDAAEELEPSKKSEVSNELDRQKLELEIDSELAIGSAYRLPKSHIPKFELHHGFDVVKKDKDEVVPPLALSDLFKLLSNEKTNTFSVGGWFIFRKADVWAYRSNEFANGVYEDAISRLERQASTLKEVLTTCSQLKGYTFHSGYSLENVMAIWSFP